MRQREKIKQINDMKRELLHVAYVAEMLKDYMVRQTVEIKKAEAELENTKKAPAKEKVAKKSASAKNAHTEKTAKKPAKAAKKVKKGSK